MEANQTDEKQHKEDELIIKNSSSLEIQALTYNDDFEQQSETTVTKKLMPTNIRRTIRRMANKNIKETICYHVLTNKLRKYNSLHIKIFKFYLYD